MFVVGPENTRAERQVWSITGKTHLHITLQSLSLAASPSEILWCLQMMHPVFPIETSKVHRRETIRRQESHMSTERPNDNHI